jgi:hypothetical protein
MWQLRLYIQIASSSKPVRLCGAVTGVCLHTGNSVQWVFCVCSQTSRKCAVFGAVPKYYIVSRSCERLPTKLDAKWKYRPRTQGKINQFITHHGNLLQWTTCSICTTIQSIQTDAQTGGRTHRRTCGGRIRCVSYTLSAVMRMCLKRSYTYLDHSFEPFSGLLSCFW